MKINFLTNFHHSCIHFKKKILINQFNDFNKKQLIRIHKAEIYYNNLKALKSLSFPQNEFSQKNIFLEFPILCKSQSIKNNLFEYLMDKKIDIKNYYYKNCSEEKIYNETKNFCINSKDISDNLLMLPVHEKITQDYQYQLVNEIKNFFLEKTN